MTPEEIASKAIRYNLARPELANMIRQAIAEERAACAKIADDAKGGQSLIGPAHGIGWGGAATAIAAAIRARSSPKEPPPEVREVTG